MISWTSSKGSGFDNCLVFHLKTCTASLLSKFLLLMSVPIGSIKFCMTCCFGEMSILANSREISSRWSEWPNKTKIRRNSDLSHSLSQSCNTLDVVEDMRASSRDQELSETVHTHLFATVWKAWPTLKANLCPSGTMQPRFCWTTSSAAKSKPCGLFVWLQNYQT